MVTEDIEKESGYDEITTKQKILICAVNLFARKGYTESTIRELAQAVGLKGASLYNHFPSKNAILEYILEDYLVFNADGYNEQTIREKLRENPTVDGVMDSLKLAFPEDKIDYYLKVLCVLLQEQHRNPLIHDFMTNHIILGGEKAVRFIFQILKEMNVIRLDTDLDPWVKTYSSLLYTFSSRMLLGIGDRSEGYSGMGMTDIMRFQFSLLLSTNAVEKAATD